MKGSVTLHANGISVTNLQMISILCLGLKQGDIVEITVEGEDEQRVFHRLKQLFETHFDFPAEQEEDNHDTQG